MRLGRALIIAGLVSVALSALAHDHPPEHAQLHDQFYNRLRQPDKPNAGCCADKHCYPTPARFENGVWWAFRKSKNAFVSIPAHKVNKEPTVDGQAHLCEGADDDPSWPGILCFVPPFNGT